MSWFSSSVFPESLVVVETWLVRLFLFLAALAILPLLSFFIYDFLLYLWRTATYELPVIGGRARGKARPRAPSTKDNSVQRVIAAVSGDTTHNPNDGTRPPSTPDPSEDMKLNVRKSAKGD